MVDLRAMPYYLSDEEIAWVNDTIAHMTNEEKVGQLFFENQGTATDDQLRELVGKYHIGGFRYNGIKSARVREVVDVLQKASPIPLFIACNTETGGNGSGTDGTFISSCLKIGATGQVRYARDLGFLSNQEAAAMGNNMAFAPVCDIHYNWENTEVVSRCFGNDVQRVADMSVAYMQGVHELPGYASVAKHFPGNGQDFRDAHLSNNINSFSKEEWMATYGKVYKALIDAGLDGVMGGHIMMPNYMREVKPGITDDEMLPATLCPEILTGLLRDELGFNGVVVSDATHMVGMTNRMKRKDMVPAAINAGCDMFLFFNDAAEDFGWMLDAYRTGVISEARMTEALTRILGLKVHMGLTKKAKEDITPSAETLAGTLGRQEYTDTAAAIARDAITLVKYKDEGVLPVTPEKYKRIMLVNVKGSENAMTQLMRFAFGAGPSQTPAELLCERLRAKGFDAFLYESPLERVKKLAAEGKQVGFMDMYHEGKSSVEGFAAGQDLILTVFNVDNGRPTFGMSKGGGEIPWYVHDVPTIGISVNAPTMLADVPTLRTYINAYDSRPYTLDALVDKLMQGPEAFTGKDPIDSFCGMWDTHI